MSEKSPKERSSLSRKSRLPGSIDPMNKHVIESVFNTCTGELAMAKEISRRQLIRSGAALAGLEALGIPEWALPALAQGEEVIAWTDLPANFNPSATQIDIRTMGKSTFITPTEKFFAVQHYNVPSVDAATFKLRIT